MKAHRIVALAAALVPLFAGTVLAASTPAERCEQTKLKATAKFVGCRLTADATFAVKQDASKRDIAYLKCAQRLSDAYAKVEQKYPGLCPTSGDGTSVESFLQSCSEKQRDWTSGLLDAPFVFERAPQTGETVCWLGGNATANPLPGSCAGTGQDAETRTGAPLAFTDGGDGTITDSNTGLQWEKKSDDGGLHDKDNTYSWVGICTGDRTTWCTRDSECAISPGGTCSGSTIFQWIDQVNASNFAGHNDWRIPNVRELASLVDYSVGYPDVAMSTLFNTNCGLHSIGNAGCDVTTCSCTGRLADYWTSSTLALGGGLASNNGWSIYAPYGYTRNDVKTTLNYVRAVRGGR